MVHAHDWQAGLAPAYLAFAGGHGPATVLRSTIWPSRACSRRLHRRARPAAGEASRSTGYESWGRVGFLKAGLYYADRLTTVSPTYAQEIQTEAEGMGLEACCAPAPTIWSASSTASTRRSGTRPPIRTWRRPTTPTSSAGRAANRAAVQAALRPRPRPDALLCTVVSRLTEQKGLDLLLAALPTLLAHGGQLALLGSGEPALEAGFRAAAAAHPGRVGCVFGYDEPLAHLLQGGADAILVPSRFEPCGLTQLYGLRYGTMPIVARVGGLADTVIDANEAALADGVATGFLFAPVTAEALGFALARAAALRPQPEAWRRLQARAMTRTVSWQRPGPALPCNST